MSDQISKLRSLSDEIKARESELRTYFKDLSLRLKDAAGGRAINGSSDNCTLEIYGEDDEFYGHLYFDKHRLTVCYRTREDDRQGAFENEAGMPLYQVRTFDQCTDDWLRALSSKAVVESLLATIIKKVEEELSETQEGIQMLSATANLPLRHLDSFLVEAAKYLSFGAVIEHWKDAQAALGIDAADAITRASSLIETLCIHILNSRTIPLPTDKSIQGLYKAVSKVLPISPNQQVTDDLRALAGGMMNLVIHIGALRTHAGTAHGKGPDHKAATIAQARLAVNAAGVLATYLMDLLSRESAHNTPL